MIPDWLWQVITVMASAGAVYAGIRADLAAIKERADSAHSTAQRAHERIDGFFQRHGGA